MKYTSNISQTWQPYLITNSINVSVFSGAVLVKKNITVHFRWSKVKVTIKSTKFGFKLNVSKITQNYLELPIPTPLVFWTSTWNPLKNYSHATPMGLKHFFCWFNQEPLPVLKDRRHWPWIMRTNSDGVHRRPHIQPSGCCVIGGNVAR